MNLTNEWDILSEKILSDRIILRKISSKFPMERELKVKKVTICSALCLVFSLAIFNGYTYIKDVVELNEPCLFQVPELIPLAFRPAMDCSLCKDIQKVHRVSKISIDSFEKNYAYSQQPVIIVDAMRNWSAPSVFNFEYFKKLFGNEEVHSGDMCQFFPYKTDFKSLGEAMNMTLQYMRNMKWYIGW